MQLHRLTFVHYADVRNSIAHGDLLLFRRRGLISKAGRGVHSHAAKAAWWDGCLFCLEVREWFGGRAVTLSSQVRRHPGRIDVFTANAGNRWSGYNRSSAVVAMRRLAGCDYGYRNVLAASLLHLPITRMFAQPHTDDAEDCPLPPFCSQAVSRAERLGGGVDPVPNLADCFTEPADLREVRFMNIDLRYCPKEQMAGSW